jgi:hypothetical protein
MELDLEALARLLPNIEKRIERHEHRQRMAPLHEAMFGNTENLITRTSPDLIAGPTARARQSVIKLEERQSESDRRFAEAERKLQLLQEASGLRTKALRSWLEEIS